MTGFCINPQCPTQDKEGDCWDTPQLRVLLLTLLPLQSNWTDTLNMSSEAPGHKTGKTVLLHSCCNHTLCRHTYAHQKTPTEVPYHTQGRKRKNLQRPSQRNMRKWLHAWTAYAQYYITITVAVKDNKHAAFSLPFIAHGVCYHAGILAQVFHLSIYPNIFSTQSLKEKKIKNLRWTGAGILRIRGTFQAWGPQITSWKSGKPVCEDGLAWIFHIRPVLAPAPDRRSSSSAPPSDLWPSLTS